MSRKKHTFDCPEDWGFCPRNVVESTVTLTHSVQIRSGLLRYKMYTYAEAITKKLAEVSGAKMEPSSIGRKQQGMQRQSSLRSVNKRNTGPPAEASTRLNSSLSSKGSQHGPPGSPGQVPQTPKSSKSSQHGPSASPSSRQSPRKRQSGESPSSPFRNSSPRSVNQSDIEYCD